MNVFSKKILVVFLIVISAISVLALNITSATDFQDETVAVEKDSRLFTTSQYSTIAFITTTVVQKIEGVNAGIVAAETKSSLNLIKVIVSPYREIPIGTEMKLLSIFHRDHTNMPIRVFFGDRLNNCV